jgi:polar amino acid transport system permease protein
MAIQAERERVVDDLPFSVRAAQFPWWLLVIVTIILLMGYRIVSDTNYAAAYRAIVPGIGLTIYVTIVSFLAALIIGLIAGLGRVSNNFVFRNLATAYIEFVRGVPILVLIFTVALVIVPAAANVLPIDNRAIPMDTRAIIALALIYGAFLAEVFRAGVESVAPGQMEAARSLGMSHFQAMRYIILPQAIRNILPALGNDFIAMLKDSSLVSVLAVRDLTQQARLFAGSTFRFQETYLVLTTLYLVMTILLSLLLQWYQRRIRKDG